MLEVRDLTVVYGRNVVALDDARLDASSAEVTAVLGVNGAGKSTLMRAISGTLGANGGEVRSGSITYEGRDITRAKPASIAAGGIALSPEGRRVFASLTVEENLRVGGRLAKRSERSDNHARVVELFPVLDERRAQHAGLLSGGEQQMLAIGRALMSSPKLLLLDEPSLGLAPTIVERIATLIGEIHRQGTAVLLVEQNARMALAVSQHAVVMETGSVHMTGRSVDLATDPAIQALYLGDSPETTDLDSKGRHV